LSLGIEIAMLGYPCYATYLLPISPMLLGHALQWSFSLSCGIITVYMLISFSISQSGCCYCIQNNLKALATNGSNLIANGSVSTCCMHVDSHSFLGPTINVLKTWTETPASRAHTYLCMKPATGKTAAVPSLLAMLPVTAVIRGLHMLCQLILHEHISWNRILYFIRTFHSDDPVLLSIIIPANFIN